MELSIRKVATIAEKRSIGDVIIMAIALNKRGILTNMKIPIASSPGVSLKSVALSGLHARRPHLAY